MQLNMAKKNFDNQSVISSLKGADRVRKRPAVIFGSDGLEGCEHSFFEILSNSIDEAREGFGKVINVTFMSDHTITVEDFGRGVPLDWNEKEGRYNWELVYCELYAGGKYNNSESALRQTRLGRRSWPSARFLPESSSNPTCRRISSRLNVRLPSTAA